MSKPQYRVNRMQSWGELKVLQKEILFILPLNLDI